MVDHGLRWRRAPGPVTKVFGSIGTAALVNSLGDQELDEPMPKVVWYADRSSHLRALALGLAEAGRDDPEAVGELGRAAGRHTKELRRAAATIRADGLAREDLAAFRANRLLVAAATGKVVEPISAEQLAWFAQVQVLADVPPDAALLASAFADLAALEPGLADVEQEVRSAAGTPEWAAMDDHQRHREVTDICNHCLEAIEEMTDHPLVRTRAARHVVWSHLSVIAGQSVPGPDEAAT